MSKGKVILVLAIIFTIVAFGANNNGAISEKDLVKIQESFEMDKYTKAMQNAVSNGTIKTLALNREEMGKIDHHFAHKIKTPGITNQKSSGRCWLFTSLNVLRPQIVEKYNLDDFNFSENYLFFWDQFEKANLFLENIIQTKDKDIDHRRVQWLFRHPIGDGGVWSMMPGIAEKYGVVPEQAMMESHNSENTSWMRRLLRRKLREQGLQLRDMKDKSDKYLHKKKVEMLSDIYRILAISLGTPPREFTWRYVAKDDSVITSKKYTPQEFFTEVIDDDLFSYVMLMDDPTRDYSKLYEIEYDRNRYDGQNWIFINLPVNEIKQYAKESILSDEPMYFSCDVGKQLNNDDGILALNQYDFESVFGMAFAMDKKERILSYESGSYHGMALIGVDTTETGETSKWLLENSWGADSGYKGFLIMTDDWFDEYMFRLVVKREFLPEKVLNILDDKPILLPPWDRMY